ncbi:Elongation factor 1-alpha [Penicillium ucsense]|uniref:Elongation factor 1-alpha n=1 Tax=Penicillium ucsense TaxID=2839758 RepID=A0A8J8VZG0_9EURO|nr:Elongation factor 1-alpha [Penicillium ucsense]KAF7734593.1 Elongation factor 1-alpha [Penicillium ucsense]
MASEKPCLDIAVVGREDSGKSSVVRQLLLSAGEVDDETWDFITNSCQGSGKEYAELAWICDTLEDERENDCSTNITIRTFETSNYKVVLTGLSSRSSQIRVKSAVVGLCAAECALVVVPADEDEFTVNFAKAGQLREHCLLAQTLGVTSVIVAINTMDTCGWSQDSFDQTEHEMERFLRRIGFRDDSFTIVPVSAMQKENITTAVETASWYHGPTLIEAIDSVKRSKPVCRLGSSTSLRVAIQDVRQVPSAGKVAIARVISGTLVLGMSVTVFPTEDTFEIYSLESFGEAIDQALPGMIVAFTPSDDSLALRRGHIISAAEEPAVGCQSFVALFYSSHPGKIHNDYTPVVHCGTARVPCRFELLQTLNPRNGRIEEGDPEYVPRQGAAIVKMVNQKPMYVDSRQESPVFSRLVIRDNGRTVGTGGVKSVEPRVAPIWNSRAQIRVSTWSKP